MMNVAFSSPRVARVPWLRVLAAIVAMTALLFALPAFADPPGRVGRLAAIGGQVWLFDSEAGEWIGADLNRPITSGDRLAVDDESRAEVRIGSTVLRIGADSDVEVVRLDDAAIRVRLYSGRIAARLRSPEAAREFDVVTDEGRFEPLAVGHYRIDRRNDTSAATAWSGAMRFTAADSQLDIEPGRRNEFWSEDGRTHYSIIEPARDAFADWALAEDRRDERHTTPRHVSPEMTGVEDLARHGYWQSSAEYGSLWVPHTVVAGWAPYRHGHWTWVSPWGWTWIDHAPWGFAPFHYGRWVWYGQRWCWAPGAYVARPVYAPALVAWVGGPGASLSIHAGPRVGWFPLAPREVYVPPYRASHVHIRNVNITHAPHVDPRLIAQPARAAQHVPYVNRHVPDAVTVVPAHVVERRHPVGRFVDPRGAREAVRAPVSVVAPLAPPRAAVPGGPHVAPVAPPIARAAEPGRGQHDDGHRWPRPPRPEAAPGDPHRGMFGRARDDARPGFASPRDPGAPHDDSGPRAGIRPPGRAHHEGGAHPAAPASPPLATPPGQAHAPGTMPAQPRGGFSRDDSDERRRFIGSERGRGRGDDGSAPRAVVPHAPAPAQGIPQAPAAPPMFQQVPRIAHPSFTPPAAAPRAQPAPMPQPAPPMFQQIPRVAQPGFTPPQPAMPPPMTAPRAQPAPLPQAPQPAPGAGAQQRGWHHGQHPGGRDPGGPLFGRGIDRNR